MGEFAFIGRESELAILADLVEEAARGRGSVALVESHAGGGKTAVVKEFRRRLALQPGYDSLTISQGNCWDGLSAGNPFEPFAEALVNIAAPERRGEGRRKSALMVELLKTCAPDLLHMLPIIGPAAAAMTRVASTTGQWWLSAQPGELEVLSRTITSQFIDAFTKIADSRGPLVILIEDAHWCDPSSAALLSRLSKQINDHPIALVVTYRPEDIRPGHALQRSLSELRATGTTKRLSIRNFTKNELAHHIHQLYGPDVVDRLAGFLFEHCGGHPLIVASYLKVLETGDALIPNLHNQAIGDAAVRSWTLMTRPEDLPLPDSVDAVLSLRSHWLDHDQQRMMQVASVQGVGFLAQILSQILRIDEDEVLRALKRVDEEHGLISETTPDEWVRDWSDVFFFEHQLMRRKFYGDLTALQRTRYHAEVGTALLERLRNTRFPPRRFVLETAHHLELGRQWSSAAEQYRRAARSCYLDGAFSEATSHAEQGLKCIRNLSTRENPDLARLQARIIQMLLISSELTWWNAPATVAGRPVLELLAEAEAAAAWANDLQLVAELTFLRAKVILLRNSLPESLQLFERAVEQSRSASDDLGEVIGLTELGHHTVGVDLERGLTLLKQANELWMVRLSQFESTTSPSKLCRHLSRLQVTIGIAYFDKGQFDDARIWLERSIEVVRNFRMPDLYTGSANFNAQLNIAIGRFEQAESILKDALLLPFRDDEGAMDRAYLMALLGKLYLEWGRVDDAVEILTRAFERTRESHNTAIVPLIRNYYCELLLCRNSRARDLTAAQRLLELTIRETVQSGFRRSEVVARMLLAIAHSQRGWAEEALLSSTEAVRLLDDTGTLPAVRSEEVFFVQYKCMAAVGDVTTAADYLEKAKAEVMRKAGSIADPITRASFLDRVPLSREVLLTRSNPSADAESTPHVHGG